MNPTQTRPDGERLIEDYLDFPPIGSWSGTAAVEARDLAKTASLAGSAILSAPAGDPVTPGAVLRAAATYLQRHGWCQAAYYDYNRVTVRFTPPADVVGAIGMVCYGGPVDAPAQHFDAPEWADFEAAVACLERYLAGRYGCDVYEFNDVAGRTSVDVVGLLEHVAGLDDGLRHTPVCCQRLMVEQDASPAVLLPREALVYPVVRVFLCPACQRVHTVLVAECATERGAIDRARAIRADLAVAWSSVTPANDPAESSSEEPLPEGSLPELPPHADYPHEPGLLSDCPRCEARCYCFDRDWQCVHCAIAAEGIGGDTTPGGVA